MPLKDAGNSLISPPSGNATPRVRVLVVNHNAGPWLARCLESLRVQSIPDFEAVIVDNASADESRTVRIADPRFRFLPQSANLGFAAANNLAARGAQTPWLALLNPDAMAQPDWLEHLLREVATHPDCDIFGSAQLRATDPDTLDGTGDCLSLYGLGWRSGYGHPRPASLPEGEVYGACGAAMMIRRSRFESLSGFEEKLFCYLEDSDLCFRARLQGSRVWQSSGAIVHHVGGASSGKASPFSLYQGNRNLIWLFFRCMPMPWLPISLPFCLGFMLLRMMFLPVGLKQRAAMLRGLWDGIRGCPGLLEDRRRIQASRSVSRIAVLRWLSCNPLDAPRRRCIFMAPKKNARP
ncbi:MAG: glycosyltransferase family 2 protein [Panacagrimonas sp.]